MFCQRRPISHIATASEHVSKHLVQDILDYKNKEVKQVIEKAIHGMYGLVSPWKLEGSSRSKVLFKEIMRGHVGGMPCTAYLKMKLNSRTSKDDEHPLLTGTLAVMLNLTPRKKKCFEQEYPKKQKTKDYGLFRFHFPFFLSYELIKQSKEQIN